MYKKRKQYPVGCFQVLLSCKSCFDVLMWMACLTCAIMAWLQLVRVFLVMSAWRSMSGIKQIYANFLLMFSAYFICSYWETLLKCLTVRTLYNTGSRYALRAVRRTQPVFSSKKYSWATFSNSSISRFFPKKNILLDFSNISWIAIWSGLLLQQEFWPISTPKHYPLCIHQDVPDGFVI